MTGGAKAGVAIGVIFGVGVIAALIFFFIRKKKSAAESLLDPVEVAVSRSLTSWEDPAVEDAEVTKEDVNDLLTATSTGSSKDSAASASSTALGTTTSEGTHQPSRHQSYPQKL
jgi:hypothetical protein